jgi:REP element-mobilizing transposase RayT
MARGIEKRLIFVNDADRANFLQRLGELVQDAHTPCLAWTLMPNHFHLLLKTDQTPISTFMRRLMTGHATWFNTRHQRSGHLFQNRFKSILCQEDTYLLELVRYIHLNPLRAKQVRDYAELCRYPYCGHSAILENSNLDWQDTSAVLTLFDKKPSSARRRYSQFVQKGIAQGNRSDLTGGGLIRSVGGWTAVKAMRRAKVYQKSDERILGDGSFVESTLDAYDESFEKKYLLKSMGYTLDDVVNRVSETLKVKPQLIWSAGRHRKTVQARSLMCFWAVRELGLSMSEIARKLNLSVMAVSKSVARGAEIAAKKKLLLIEKNKFKSIERP